jgi:hypothetical protein
LRIRRQLRWQLGCVFNYVVLAVFSDAIHRRHEAIATARHRLNKLRTVGAFAQRFSQQRNVLGKVTFFYEGIRPDFLHQIVFVDDASVVFQQRQKYVKRFRRQRNEVLAAPQNAFVRFHAEPAKLIKIAGLLGHKRL